MNEPIGPPLDFRTAPLDGSVLVEASAGTGKTWTIGALVLRLLLEPHGDGRRCRIEDILVVTYTNAATAELRDRILALLVAARESFASGEATDPRIVHALAVTEGRRAEAHAELDLAIESFDLAPVHTIHGFCQRVLADQAFESGGRFETSIVADETALREAAAQDFWRREMARIGAGRAAGVLRSIRGPQALLERARPALDRPYAHLVEIPPASDIERLTAAMHGAFGRARSRWLASRRDVMARIAAAKLHGGRYPPGKLPEWRMELDAYFGGSPGESPPEVLAKFAPAALEKSRTRAGTVPDHRFFGEVEALLAAHAALEAGNTAANAELVARFVAFCREELGRRKRERALLSYDDLLLGMRSALRGAGGARLAAIVRRRYQAALIDEFQDTDPVQAEVLDRIWGGSGQPLYLVGDPKQAIYGFRGADVFAYLDSRARADARFTLAENQRSDPPLLDAVAALFAGPGRFLIPEIGLVSVAPTARPRATLVIEDGAKPLTIWRVDPVRGENKNAVRRRIADAVAADIARLLQAARAERARILEPGGAARKLAMSDIAVLVSTHAEGDIVRAALAEVGLASVTYGADSVYRAREAEDLERILRAVAEPGSEALLRAALATEAIGMTAAELAALAPESAGWAAWVARFREYHDLARSGGFVRMWREAALREGIAERLLAHPDGERRMTNMAHLVELLHGRAEQEGLDLAQLSRALAHARESPIHDPEAEQLRLESDEDLVSILTVFRAKGLEYPVVYCPFLWDGNRRRDQAAVFHSPVADGRACVDLGGPDFDAHRTLESAEALAGDLRLAYVALTRAEHRCTIAWGERLRDADASALAWLLHAPEPGSAEPVGALRAVVRALDDAARAARLARLEVESNGAIAVLPLPARASVPGTVGPAPPAALTARAAPAPIAPAWRVSSFSSLVARGGDEAPDYDAARGATAAQPAVDRADAFALPRGVRLGTALHKVFEALDFPTAAGAPLDAVVRRELAGAGIGDAWTPVAARVVTDVLDTPLDAAGFRLRDLVRRDRVDELEFTYPIRGASGRELAAALAPMRDVGSRIPEAIGALIVAPARGYMRGYIDLVFARDGRYYLADYKSNWLGDAVEDYAADRLGAAMADALYDLQYLVYTVALHRMLATRVRGYDYERHFGGVYYLFLRGMRPALGPAAGVHFVRPGFELVRALDACLGTGAPLLDAGARA